MINETVARADYVGNAVTSAFVYPFKIADEADLLVYVDEVLKALSTHYTVSGVGSDSGSVTFVTASIPGNGAQVTILRKQPLEQQSDYLPNEGFPSTRVEQDLDNLAMADQMLSERIKRAIKLPIHSILTDVEFPEPEAGKYVRATVDGYELVELTDSAVVDLVAGDVKAVSDYASFAAAVTAIGATITTLYVNQACTVSTAVVVPSTLHIVVIGSGSFTKSGSGTITFNGPFEAPLRTIFSGFAAGNISGLKSAYPQWWGAAFDDATDDYTAWNCAIGSISIGTVEFTPGTSRIGTGLAFPASTGLRGAGMRACTLKYTGSSGYAVTFGSTSSSSLSYGCGARDFALVLTNNGGNCIRVAGTAGAHLQDIYLEGVPSTNTSVGVYLDGGNAANIFTTMSNIIANHIKFGYEFNSSGSSFTTSAVLTNCEAFGDLTAGSIGFNFAAGNCDGCRIIGGNAENCVQGIKSAGTGVSVFGLRFEGNTTDVRLEATSQANSFIACQNLATLSDASGHISNSFLANQTNGVSPTQLTNKLEQLTVFGNVTILKNQAGNRFIILDAGTTGSLIMQAGPGTGAVGGSVILRGSSHADNGSVIAGLGGTGARKFRVNSDGLGAGTDLFSVDESGYVVIGVGGATIKKHLTGTATWNPASIADGAVTNTTVTVTGAVVGDTVTVGFSVAVPANAFMVGSVTAADTVTVTLFNKTGGALDLGSGTLRADVWQH